MKIAAICIALLLIAAAGADADIFTDADGGHEQAVIAAIEKGVDVNSKNENGMTALHVAAQKGHPRLVSALLSKGADPDILDNSRRSAFYYALHGGHNQTAELIGDASNLPCTKGLVFVGNERRILIEQSNIEWFDWQKQEFRLKNASKPVLPVRTLQEPFELWLNGRLVYSGWVQSPLSSHINPGITISTTDGMPNGRTYRITQLWNPDEVRLLPDRQYDLELYDHLKQAGLLRVSKPPIKKWKNESPLVVHAVILEIPDSYPIPSDVYFTNAACYKMRVMEPYKGVLKKGEEFELFVDTFGLQKIVGTRVGSELIVFAHPSSWKQMTPSVLVAHENGRAYVAYNKDIAEKL